MIAEALQSLPERKRDIILLSYFLELSDREIGDKLNMLRSTVQYQRTNNGIGAEQRGYRPVLIIQNNTGNKFSPTVIVAVITGQIHHKARMPTHCQLSSHSALSIPSMALLEQITTIDKRRLKKYIGRISEEEISCINKALSISVGLESL